MTGWVNDQPVTTGLGQLVNSFSLHSDLNMLSTFYHQFVGGTPAPAAQ
jgi:hypothetical protein